jgi:hypothetical protein
MEELSVTALRRAESKHRDSTQVREQLFLNDVESADELEAEIDSAYSSEPVPRSSVDEDDVEKPASPVRHDEEYAVATQETAEFPPGEAPVASNE